MGHPDRTGAALVLAVGADQVGLQTTQQLAVTSDPAWRGGDHANAGRVSGPGIARRIAHLSSRSGAELEDRLGRAVQADGRFAVDSYLEHQADKLVGGFDAGSYVALTQAMNTHAVGRGRGGVAAALGSVTVPVVVAGTSSDRLYPLDQQQEIADLVPTASGLLVRETLDLGSASRTGSVAAFPGSERVTSAGRCR